MKSFLERVKDFFKKMFAEKKANTIFIIAMIAIIVVCLILILCQIIPGCQGQSKNEDLADTIVSTNGDNPIAQVDPNQSEQQTLEIILANPLDEFVITPEPVTSDDPTTNADQTALPTDSTTDSDTIKVTVEPDPNAGKSAKDYVPRRISVNFDAMSAINSDVCAWLYLQDTIINYPVLVAPENDRSFYLTHMYDKSENIVGSLYISDEKDSTFSSRNTVIHGHRMNNGSMFGTLYKYKKQTYYEGNPIIQLYTPVGVEDYYICIFAAYETDILTTHTGYSSDEAFQQYLNECMSKSVIKTIVTPTVNDRIVTLSTCVVGKDTERMIVQGVLRPMN